ncbi:MAG: N-acetyltransferase [Clostridiales bacterium]|jgi:RimJ/RimL family protein N-acetyltransferase|nr:N-acetyltransferase [Clostridiales bacterium]
MVIREIQLEDENKFYTMQQQIDNETKFMMYEPNERPVGNDEFTGIINYFKKSGSLMLVAVDDNEMAGVIAAERGGQQRIKHTAYISTGLLLKYRNQGIGSQFLKRVEEWAITNGITRLELTVMCHNEAAYHLYQKCGFQVEGKRLHAMKVDNNYVDEYYMAKLL